ncbi:hypothetical protein Tco_1235687 [Tanacetum coccineum]
MDCCRGYLGGNMLIIKRVALLALIGNMARNLSSHAIVVRSVVAIQEEEHALEGMDVKTAFLIWFRLDEDIYMAENLKGYVNPKYPKRDHIMYAVDAQGQIVAFAQNLVSSSISTEIPGKLHGWAAVYGVKNSSVVSEEHEKIVFSDRNEQSTGKEQEAENNCNVCNTSEYTGAFRSCLVAVWIRKFC